MLAYRKWYVVCTNQIVQDMYLTPIRSPHQGMYLAPIRAPFLFLGLSGVQISTKFGDSESAVRKMESSFRMRNVGISVFLLGYLWQPSHKMPLFFVVFFFFSSATKWKNCAIVPRGHWALNTMTTNCDPMRVKMFTC